MKRFIDFLRQNIFNIASWMITLLLVAGLLLGAFAWKKSTSDAQVLQPQPTAAPDESPVQVALPAIPANDASFTIGRGIELKTNIPADRPRYQPVTYKVMRGDAMLAIAKEFHLKSESILYNNKKVLEDNPHNLRPGMELLIPPVDGIYYTWQKGDTLEKIATKFKANVEDMLDFPGNKLDITNPEIQTGTLVMIPGGSRELRNWEADLQTASRVNNGSTGTSEVKGSSCPAGPVASGLGWPADDHTLSGNDYGPGHLGIDITAPEGSSVYAAGAGVVTMAQGGWNYGYGNVIQIDHGNGYVTVYAHLSQINVSVCQPVGRGTLIGLSGNTGNSFGAHLHFEIRIGGKNVNPLEFVQ